MSLKNLNAKIKTPKVLQKKLDNKKILQIYKKFEKDLNIKQNFVVAVSGGPDSLALAFLAKIYSIKKKLISKFFIVDHRLRKNSSQEAKYVKKILNSMGIFSHILVWRGKKPSKNIQSIARNKRYELIINQCNKLKFENILLGHHQDDLMENFFLRILRGSGLKGLISLDKKTKIKKINLHRPLLNQKKENLIYIAQSVFDFYVEDPSNQNEKFQRIRIRNLIKELKKNGLDKKKFLNTIKNLKHSDSAINFYVRQNLKENTFFFKKKKEYILNKNFFQQAHEIVFRSLSTILHDIGGKYYSVRGKKIDLLISNIKNNKLSKVTLGGCIIKICQETVIITKEY